MERALRPEYQLTLGWEGFDIFHVETGWRVEVKQSALLQAWGNVCKAQRCGLRHRAPHR